jgi:dihydrofolate reductase
MLISIIAAMARNRVIGVENRLPWRLPEDLRRFKALTMGKPIIMGRATFESIGKALPGRRNIVLTHQPQFAAPDCQAARSLEEALQLAEPAPEVMVIGGAQVYRQALPRCQRIYLTLVDTEVPGDAFFPELVAAEWHELARQPGAPDATTPYRYEFVTLQRA